ncbi:hypothetical protein O3P69_017988 [Scylla paramamosain]|uniref:Uncharacterized protein n=1 Tax=Scylla paramamosain TaxID=85552 RepID=A0AAW0TI93_SCYPA
MDSTTFPVRLSIPRSPLTKHGRENVATHTKLRGYAKLPRATRDAATSGTQTKACEGNVMSDRGRNEMQGAQFLPLRQQGRHHSHSSNFCALPPVGTAEHQGQSDQRDLRVGGCVTSSPVPASP